MSKLLVSIYYPIYEKKVDTRIPMDLTVKEVLVAMGGYFSKDNPEKTKDCVLCNMETGEIIDNSAYFGNLKLHAGNKLMIM